MSITIEEKKQKAIECMCRLDIYKPYIKAFKESNNVCFYEDFGGFWTDQEPELAAKIKEFEEEHNALVYAVTHEYTRSGELYDLIYISDHKEDWEYMFCKEGSLVYVSAYVWNKSIEWYSDLGTIGIRSFGGGIKRFK